tara:strand:- start:941 stop:1210 length:270 start_codon:yes stop_codon:yes gene_type:complete
MKIDKELLKIVSSNSDVFPGNIYPAKGGRRTPSTDFWLVVSCSTHGAHCLGFNSDGEPVSTASYNKSAMRERPLVGRVDMGAVVLKEFV